MLYWLSSYKTLIKLYGIFTSIQGLTSDHFTAFYNTDHTVSIPVLAVSQETQIVQISADLDLKNRHLFESL